MGWSSKEFVSFGKEDSEMEVELYEKMLPPGFRWTSTNIPRIAVWILIVILSPITIIWSVAKAVMGRKN